MLHLTKITVDDTSRRTDLSWCEGKSFYVPTELIVQWKQLDCLSSDNKLTLPNDPISFSKNSISALQSYGAYCKHRPISSRLPFNSQIVPTFLRTLYAKCLGATLRSKVLSKTLFPQWPLDLSVDFLNDVCAPQEQKPNATLCLTHDIDSPEGLQNLVKYFLPIEEEAGFRSTNFIVPCGWKLDLGLINEIISRGHEIGVHGYNHGTRTPFLPKQSQISRLQSAFRQFESIDIKGYRAPALIRTPSLLESVSSFFEYDSSIPTSGGAFPELGGGCATARPFSLNGIKEIPLSMPRDGSLLFLGYATEEILAMWKECYNFIAASHGIIVLLTHCEKRYSGNTKMLDIYRRFIFHCRDNAHVKNKLMREVN